MTATKAARKGRRTTDAVAVVAEIDVAALKEIVVATEQGGFTYTSAEIYAPMLEAGLVEINEAISNETAQVATRATAKGIETMKNTQAETSAVESTAQAAEVVAAVVGFKIDDAVPVPSITGRGRGATVYPFDQLQVGQSFFVANSEDKPNAAKSLASTVSSANARYAVEVKDEAGNVVTEEVEVTDYKTNAEGKREKDAEGKFIVIGKHVETRPKMVETRKFIVRSVTENGQGGARIWRTQ